MMKTEENEKLDYKIKVPYGEDPYSVIGQYIHEHITCIEDIIATIEIGGRIENELFMVGLDADKPTYFEWQYDWYEGEKNIALIDFFPVSEACSPDEMLNIIHCKDCDNWDRDNVANKIAACEEWSDPENGMTRYTKECDFCSYAERRTDER